MFMEGKTMMIQVQTDSEYELQAFETQIASKTFRIMEMRWGSWNVISWHTNNPSWQWAWGCKSFPTLADVEKHYKSLRGIGCLLQEVR
jgi:hypothetical protein